ncbi:MAG: hypothetical protein J6X20_06365, partial [Bacteroidales bacterium]|nr:hypothetical protein [Bacteroidales bacterium]
DESLKGDKDCGGLIPYNYISGESMTGFASGRPLFVRTQVVAGLNYAFVCREGVNITIYAPLPGQGDPRVTSTERRNGQNTAGKAE